MCVETESKGGPLMRLRWIIRSDLIKFKHWNLCCNNASVALRSFIVREKILWLGIPTATFTYSLPDDNEEGEKRLSPESLQLSSIKFRYDAPFAFSNQRHDWQTTDEISPTWIQCSNSDLILLFIGWRIFAAVSPLFRINCPSKCSFRAHTAWVQMPYRWRQVEW